MAAGSTERPAPRWGRFDEEGEKKKYRTARKVRARKRRREGTLRVCGGASDIGGKGGLDWGCGVEGGKSAVEVGELSCAIERSVTV